MLNSSAAEGIRMEKFVPPHRWLASRFTVVLRGQDQSNLAREGIRCTRNAEDRGGLLAGRRLGGATVHRDVDRSHRLFFVGALRSCRCDGTNLSRPGGRGRGGGSRKKAGGLQAAKDQGRKIGGVGRQKGGNGQEEGRPLQSVAWFLLPRWCLCDLAYASWPGWAADRKKGRTLQAASREGFGKE